ncbi:hypothetical protein BS50DRAFT_579124 [Corynespora cassiicola Philippines]|uniref:F-box domain-containing protein n=1 Tax=Corynespora cassiicola Philippines TaxID=1448308 RepID=A0A2T2N5D3_CORCC|nr:hypothetical protein BS50DRAFT_579124 [Corynespora cassiicola Philippines]
MSMDATSGRNAVAALLEGRMGLVCELRYGRNQDSDNPVDIHVESKGISCRTTSKTSVATNRANEIDTGGNTTDRTVTARQDAQTRKHQHIAFNSVDVQANRQAVSLQGTDNDQTHHANLINQTWNLHLRGPPSDWSSQVDAADAIACPRYIPTEKGTSTFYRHLCSEDDPPRSVSICPQRRCVAFGCSAGIELHWIDALTGQSLTRWFPLTAPSDYLYFLPPRPGFESAKKLRLISSAAHPDDRPAICRKFCVGRPAMSAFWGNLGFENCSRPLGSSSCDHYHAVPLSDGHHVLFMDPQSDMLFLGCDAPLGGPTKLLRKIKFIPPRQGMVPRLYTAAADLTWGARVVVVFGDTVLFYSVPPDICNLSRLEQKAESWDLYSTPPFSTEGRDENHWLNWLVETRSSANAGHNPIWPITIHGTEIGVLRSICGLAILTRPDVTIWAFSVSSNSKVWQLRSTGGQNQACRYVCRSGIVQEAYAVDGASDETGAAIKAPGGPLIKTKNGIMFRRLPHALSIENDEWVDFVDVVGCDAWYEQSGDVVVCHGSSMLMNSWDLDGLSDCLL